MKRTGKRGTRVARANAAASGSGRTIRRDRKRRSIRIPRKDMIRMGFLVLLMLAVFFSGREIFWYVTESDNGGEKYPVRGVDVSAHQQEIDWKGLEDEGIAFAFIKATEGSDHVDENFEKNWDGAHGTDMKVGAYHFLSYDSPGRTQAENFIETVGRKWGMMPPVVDVEFYGEYTEVHPEKEKVYRVLDVVLEELEDYYGKRPIIYTNTHIYGDYISGRYDDYPIWISDHSIPDELSDGREWLFCQYTFRAVSENVANGEKYVDMNVFNGSRWDLRHYDGR